MGMYTEFHFNARLKKDTPKDVMDILHYMLRNGHTELPLNRPNHPFFECDRWQGLFTGDSAYFPMTNARCIDKEHFSGIVLNVRSNIKNYDSEIGKFLHWIQPYIDECSDTLLGYFRYEEDVWPNLIFTASDSDSDSDGRKCIVIKAIDDSHDVDFSWITQEKER